MFPITAIFSALKAKPQIIIDVVAFVGVVALVLVLHHDWEAHNTAEFNAGYAKCKAEWDKQNVADATALQTQAAISGQAVSAAVADLSTKLAQRDQTTAAVVKGMKSELSNQIYATCRVPAGGLRLYATAGAVRPADIQAQSQQGAPATVPAAGTQSGR